MRISFAAGLAFLAAPALGFAVARHPASPSPGAAPAVYRSVSGTQFYDDARDIRPPVAYDLEGFLYGANRPITGGTVEPRGTFAAERDVPYGVQVRVLSGRYRGDRGYIRAADLARARRIGDLARKEDSR